MLDVAKAGPNGDFDDGKAFEWRVEAEPVGYSEALAVMEQRITEIEAGHARELFWLLEHPPLYTAGTSAQAEELLEACFPVHTTGRGGRFTYHGPGQRIVYAMMDLRKRERDVRKHVQCLEDLARRVLHEYGINSERREGRIGLWVNTQGREEKIAAIGVRVRHWVTYHGLSINVSPNLSHYRGIVPCGLAEFGVTSLAALGIATTMKEIDARLHKHASSIFL